MTTLHADEPVIRNLGPRRLPGLLDALVAPDRKLREATRHQLELLHQRAGVVTAAPAPRYRAKKARSSGVIGWLMTRSGISQMISRGGLSRNVTPAK